MPLYTPVARVASSAAPDPLDKLPSDFDAGANPILAKHYFGISPFRSIGEVTAEVVSGLKLPHRIEPVRQPGPRSFGAAQAVAMPEVRP